MWMALLALKGKQAVKAISLKKKKKDACIDGSSNSSDDGEEQFNLPHT